GASSCPVGTSPAGTLAPQAVAAALSPPRAAISHSASVGRRQRPPHSRDSHSVKATASSQVTPTTGWSGLPKSGSNHHGGGEVSVPARNGSYSERVTGVRPRKNGASSTSWEGASSERPPSVPMRKRPPGID